MVSLPASLNAPWGRRKQVNPRELGAVTTVRPTMIPWEVRLPKAYSPPPFHAVRRPLHPMVLGIPLMCFFGALITDIAYYRTFDVNWKNFSDWLLAGGVVVGALAAIVGIVDLVRRPVRADKLIWLYAGTYVVAMILALFNNFVHSRDAYGAMPVGLVLSVLTVIALTVTAIISVPLLRQSRVGGRV